MSAVQAITPTVDFGDRRVDHNDGKRYSKAQGITASFATNDVIHLWQVNSKGNLSRCYLSIPVDKVDEFCDMLKRRANDAQFDNLVEEFGGVQNLCDVAAEHGLNL